MIIENDLAKVLWYYGFIENILSSDQKILCPFHEDANPSMLVDLSKGNYFCFGCQQAGDALSFVQNIEKKNGLNDLQSCLKFFNIIKSEKCERLKIHKHIKRQKPNSQLYVEAYDYYHGLLKIDWCVTSELTEVQEVLYYMSNRGFTASVLNEVGAKVTFNKSYPIIFPLYDNGKFKGWDCRTTDKEIEKRRKYLYNKGFRRANSLIGNYEDEEIVFVVEGYMDYVKFIQFGVRNVVCTLGWKISDIQIEKLKSNKKLKYVVSVLDNDTCGKKGSAYLKSIFGEKYIRWSFIKGIKDPGDMDEKMFKKMFKKTMSKIA